MQGVREQGLAREKSVRAHTAESDNQMCRKLSAQNGSLTVSLGGRRAQVWSKSLALTAGAVRVNRAVKNTQKETDVF